MGSAHSLTLQEQDAYKAGYDEACKRAAVSISTADIMLFAHGAGMSADSGLPVFADIARCAAYERKRLNYMDLSTPDWLTRDPEMFYGFWGKSYNDYMKTPPHKGYFIVKSWKDTFFHQNSEKISKWSQKLQQKFIKKMYEHFSMKVDKDDVVGPFFVYTSNIDSHSLRPGLFEEKEVYEIHGATEKWQCSALCSLEKWSLPDNFTFKVNMASMRSNPSAVAPCPKCGKPSRPWVYMFGDLEWAGADDSMVRYTAWREAVVEIIVEEKLKLVILEVGAGTNVPTVRGASEGICEKLDKSHCTLIRINPEFPHTDSDKTQDKIISIMECGLPAITKINEMMNV